METYKEKIIGFADTHKKGLIIAVLLFAALGMIFKGLMQIPQIRSYKAEAASLAEQIEYEKTRQQEITQMRGKVNTDEYIEKVAGEKLGLIKNNSKIFIDISEESQP